MSAGRGRGDAALVSRTGGIGFPVFRQRPYFPRMKQGHEPFRGGDRPIGATVLDFWRWSGSDLLSNVWRGVLAEFLIARALEVADKPRDEWAAYDLKTRSGVTVEVKSASYVQSWPQRRPSIISFDIAPRKWVWFAATNEYQELSPPQRVADVYVFCVLGHADRCAAHTDPLDIDQWAFHVVGRRFLDRERPRQKKIGVNALRSLMRRATPGEAAEVRYGGLDAAIETAATQKLGRSSAEGP